VSSLIEKETTNNNEHYNNRSFCPVRITDICMGVRYAMKEIMLDPIDQIEELMFHLFNNDMNRSLDSKWLDLYVSLELYKEHLEKLEEE
jgi:hypothetical protein